MPVAAAELVGADVGDARRLDCTIDGGLGACQRRLTCVGVRVGTKNLKSPPAVSKLGQSHVSSGPTSSIAQRALVASAAGEQVPSSPWTRAQRGLPACRYAAIMQTICGA
jgi:hypothetical protein